MSVVSIWVVLTWWERGRPGLQGQGALGAGASASRPGGALGPLLAPQSVMTELPQARLPGHRRNQTPTAPGRPSRPGPSEQEPTGQCLLSLWFSFQGQQSPPWATSRCHPSSAEPLSDSLQGMPPPTRPAPLPRRSLKSPVRVSARLLASAPHCPLPSGPASSRDPGQPPSPPPPPPGRS